MPLSINRFRFLLLILAAACGTGRTAPAPQPAPTTDKAARPTPPLPPQLRVEESPMFAAALAKGTRTRSGAPGPHYWQQYAKYRLEGELNPITKRLTGRGTVTYFNRSPDALPVVYVQALANIFEPDAKRVLQTPKLGGIEFTRVVAQGQTLTATERAEGPGYKVTGTIMELRLPKPLAPGGTLELEFEWGLREPSETAPRGGQDGEVWFISYWYPQMAVYDDISGWQIDQYLGRGEFYMGYADYDVTLTVPAGWLVDATGNLQNPTEVYTPQTRARLDSARLGSAVVHVVTEKDHADSAALGRGKDGKLTWRYRVENVRDFDWATSSRYVWDATRAVTDSGTAAGRADTSNIYAFYRPEGKRSYWDESARYGRHAIEFHSRTLWPYPYAHMSVVDGPEGCGGMEFPMMTCIGGTFDSLSMYEVVTHEIGHMWFPMQVGSDEKRYGWMDEGLTQFDQSQAMADFFKGFDDEERNRQYYLRFAQSGQEEEPMKPGDRYNSEPGFGVATYYKPATVLVALKSVLGRELFYKAFREYGRRWTAKHPSPYDFFNTFNDVTGQDLSWFWREWFFETWRLDQGIEAVTPDGDSTAIVLENKGKAIMPVPLAITRQGGRVDRLTVPVDVWFGGEKRYTVKVASSPTIGKIEIDPDHAFPEAQRGDGIWPRGRTAAQR